MFVFNSHGTSDSISFPDHSFLQFPSPFDDDANFLPCLQTSFMNNLETESARRIIVQQNHQRKKGCSSSCSLSSSSKRDRHSKINTLRGPRDRRMRLSLPVAREFFGLQDILGVDKASKTVEWLLFQSRHAIKKLNQSRGGGGGNGDGDATTRSSPSWISDGEVVSGVDEANVNNARTKDQQQGRKGKRKEKSASSRVARNAATTSRECRAEARARARARTREKQLQVRGKVLSADHNANYTIDGISNMSNSSSWSTQMENDNQELRTRNNNSNQGLMIIDDNNPAANDDDDCLMIMGRWSPSNSIYNSLHNNNNGNLQEHPFEDLQFFGKPWEAYNNNN